MNRSIFELLGIEGREDSFTDLLVNAVNGDPLFQNSFFENVLKITPSYGWKAVSRMPVFIYSESGKRKDCPDIIITNAGSRKCAVIENKIFSGEGWKQTCRYASDEFRKSLLEKLGFPIDEIDCFFLTLDGTPPLSESFRPVSYDRIRNCSFTRNPGEGISILLEDMMRLLDEYYSRSGPQDDDIVLEYLKTGKGLINPFRNFQLFAGSLFNRSDYKTDISLTSNRGSGYIPICLVFRDNWTGGKYCPGLDGKNCFDIHYELQWDTREEWENLTLYIHYHTNPYMTQKKIKEMKISEAFLEAFESRRKALFSYLLKANVPGWRLSLTTLRIARFAFGKNDRYRNIRDTILELLSSTSTHIDKFLEKSS